MNPRVFWGASSIVALLLVAATAAPRQSDFIFSSAQRWVIGNFGWFYVAAVAGFLVFVLFLALGATGRVRLGNDDAEPEFPYLSWLAMLFAAGMGIGLMYFAVAEPVQHYIAPPEVEAGTILAAREAMVITFMHWGVHAWAIYAIVGLSLAYSAHRKGLPLTMRSGLQPLLGRHVKGPIGDAVDIFAICGTLFGIATSLGLGVAQMNSGLAFLLGVPNTTLTQILLIALVMGIATASVLSGLDRGVRRLSELNLALAVMLMLFVLVTGPTRFLLEALVQNFGLYLDHFFIRTFTLYAYEPRSWMADWTLFYWAWWIAWSPFVGMFIARISRGRTVREFVAGVLLVPTAFSFLWMTVFGNTAMALDMGEAAGAIAKAVQADLSTALFHFLAYLPGTAITSTLAVALVIVFFVTSADSASLVIDSIASGGKEDTPVWQRVYWCSLEGLAAALLLLAGGLTALQAATLVAALPFAIVLILLSWGLYRGLSADLRGEVLGDSDLDGAPLAVRLRRVLVPTARRDVELQLEQAVTPALDAVRAALASEGVEAEVTRNADSVALKARGADGSLFAYAIRMVMQPLAAYSLLEARPSQRTFEWRLHVFVAEGHRVSADVTDFGREQIVANVLEKLSAWRKGRTGVADAASTRQAPAGGRPPDPP